MKKIFFCVLLSFLFFALSEAVSAQAAIRQIFFPTEKNVNFTDSFGDPRGSGRTHEGIDIMGEQMMELYSAVDGTVREIVLPEAWYGYAVTLADDEGYEYCYLHINNDTPGTDDGKGGSENAYAPGLEEGARVSRWQFIGWMGDSGNAEAAGHHLHFEIRQPDGTAINPYASLVAAFENVSVPVIDFDPINARDEVPDINTDKSLPAAGMGACGTSTLIKIPDSQAVYYCGGDSKRYVFPNERVFFSWYEDFDDVAEVSPVLMAGLPLGGNATYRPGVKMVKIQTDPKVYAVSKGGILRWIRSGETAAALYGKDWNSKVDDIPDSFFFDYEIGEEI